MSCTEIQVIIHKRGKVSIHIASNEKENGPEGVKQKYINHLRQVSFGHKIFMLEEVFSFTPEFNES